MANFVDLNVTLLAATTFFEDVIPDSTGDWLPDLEASGGEAIAEFAGRACYQSWNKPNPATASNADYIAHIVEVGHFSVLEHGSVTFYFEGISRSCTHELVRHRHLSYSQLSQRYVPSADTNFVMPTDPDLPENVMRKLNDAADDQIDAYRDVSLDMDISIPRVEGASVTDHRKRVRQTSRAVLGNFTETKIVVTGNFRAWRHFVTMRASLGADTEIRRLAVEVLRQLKAHSPSMFADYEIVDAPDGTEYAIRPVELEA